VTEGADGGNRQHQLAEAVEHRHRQRAYARQQLVLDHAQVVAANGVQFLGKRRFVQAVAFGLQQRCDTGRVAESRKILPVAVWRKEAGVPWRMAT
jgi:hypothetical protein